VQLEVAADVVLRDRAIDHIIDAPPGERQHAAQRPRGLDVLRPPFRRRRKVAAAEVEKACEAHRAISYRRPELPSRSIKYWLLPEINGLIESGRIEGYLGTVPTAIHPTRVTLDRSPLAGGDGDGNAQLAARGRGRMTPSFPADVPADFVLALIGYEQDNTLLKLAGVELRGSCGAPAFDERTMETNVPGVYVAGTAVGGTQEKYSVFIENCHVHVERIVAALTGTAPPASPAPLAQPES
jgi:thioredoxin reductase (NADPH)